MFSLCLTAAAIALSSLNLVVRIIVLVLVLPIFIMSLLSTMVMHAMGGATVLGATVGWVWVMPLFVAVYTYLMLEIAAGRIAPVSENHSAPKRLLALALGVGGIVVAIFFDAEMTALWMAASFLPWCWVSLEALCESTVPVPSLYCSLTRRGLFGRLAGRVLYPGWASGLVFCGMLAAMVAAAMWITISSHSYHYSRDEDLAIMALIYPIGFTAVIMPVVVLLLFPTVRQPIWLYVLVQAVCALLFLVAKIAGGNTPRMDVAEAYRWLAPLPTSALFALMDERDSETLRAFFSMVCLPVCAVIVGYLAVRAMREFHVIAGLERESLGKNPSP
jgi:hypothetical protein